jgi:hypothetical protein
MNKSQLPKSAKELSQLLLDYSTNLIRSGSPSDVNGIGELVTQYTKDDPNAPPLAKFLVGIGNGKGILACHHYWNFRDAVQEFQVLNNISSVKWKTVEWKNEQFRCPDICDQLVCMKHDLAICSKYKNKVVTKFLNFCQQWGIQIFSEDENGWRTESNTQAVLVEAEKHQWASLGRNSGFHPVYGDKTGKVLYWVSEYSIYLHSGDADEPKRDGASFHGRQELIV